MPISSGPTRPGPVATGPVASRPTAPHPGVHAERGHATLSRRGLARTLVAGLAVTGLVACGSSASADLKGVPGYVEINNPVLGPATQSITESDGSTWRFNAPAKGHVTIVYFGYTSCPDVCPTTMADLAQAMSKLSSDVRDKVWVQFVSTDPHRDTDAQIKAWLNGFDPTFHGGHAPINDVIAAAQTLGIGIEAPKVTKGDYQVTHGGSVRVLNDKGECIGTFHELAGSSSYQTALPLLVKAYT